MKTIETIKKECWDHNKEAVLNFAVACHDTNSVEELKGALQGTPDKTDMDEWGIDETQWRLAIGCALGELLSEN